MAKFDHLEKLWAAYLDYPTARQADKWLVGYFREHKNYGKKDRTWYSEAFFGLLRHALCFLPQEKKCDAREAWAALKSQPLKTLTPSLSQRGIESLPHTWHTWLQKSSLAQEDIPLFLEHLNTRPPLYLRANYPDRASEIEAELKSADFKVETIKQGRLVTFCIEGKTSIYELQCLKNGLIEIQDFASQLLGAAVDAHPRMTVWDI
ncbi:MAG TPA: hypothetical protein PLY93_12830, partial [Turneriella sp.]|nr:hypothetical protein [Turneriella sp.]